MIFRRRLREARLAIDRHPRIAVLGVVVVMLLVGTILVTSRGAADPDLVTRSPDVDPSTTAVVPTTLATTTTTTEPPTTTTTAPPTTTTTAPTTTQPPTTTTTTVPPRAAWSLKLYSGFGAWLDVFDWSSAYTNNPVGVEAIDQMAAEGVQTVYLQTGRADHPHDLVEPKKLGRLIDRAHGHGMHVIGWYLPTHLDTEVDLRRLLAAVSAGVDGLAVDIESLDQEDVAKRNQELIRLSHRLREQLPGKPIGAIVLPPVVMEDINPNYWPDYPWAGIAPYYDVWLPMSYWTNRRGEWRDAYRYMHTNMTRVRERIGKPDAPVHAVGGIGDESTVADIDGLVRAASEVGAIGGSIYDFATTKPEFWATLRAFIRP